jgi:hypothetical protein
MFVFDRPLVAVLSGLGTPAAFMLLDLLLHHGGR